MIIKYEHIRQARPIADNIDDEKRLSPYMREVENLELIPAIGAENYRELDANFDEANPTHSHILHGGYYECVSGCQCGTQIHAGLIQAVSYLTYARFARNNKVNATAFGIVTKTTQFSEPIDERTLVRHTNEAEKIGREYLRQTVEYMKCSGLICCNKGNKLFKRKFKSIGD